MSRTIALLAFAVVAPSAVGQSTTPRPSPADDKIAVEINGTIENLALRTQAPEVIVSQKGLDRLTKDWALKDLPVIDFNANLLVVATSAGGKLSMSAPRLDERGDLKPVLNETTEPAPGFRYAIRAVKRAGVVTVNGKPLPKE